MAPESGGQQRVIEAETECGLRRCAVYSAMSPNQGDSGEADSWNSHAIRLR